MIIELKKFGTTLIFRQNGSEAFKAFQTTLRDLKPEENLEVDFSGVLTFSPSWGDEFLSPLLDQFGDRLILLASDNMSVHATIKILQQVKNNKFVVR